MRSEPIIRLEREISTPAAESRRAGRGSCRGAAENSVTSAAAAGTPPRTPRHGQMKSWGLHSSVVRCKASRQLQWEKCQCEKWFCCTSYQLKKHLLIYFVNVAALVFISRVDLSWYNFFIPKRVRIIREIGIIWQIFHALDILGDSLHLQRAVMINYRRSLNTLYYLNR